MHLRILLTVDEWQRLELRQVLRMRLALSDMQIQLITLRILLVRIHFDSESQMFTTSQN